MMRKQYGHVTGIMSDDFEITDVDKCIQDILYIYVKEKLTRRKDEIIKLLDNPNLPKEEAKKLEQELSSIIIKLAKKKLEG